MISSSCVAHRARAQAGADFEHDRVDDRVALENLEDAIEIALMMPRADGAAGVERIAVAAADYVEERFQLVVRRLRQRGNLEPAPSRTYR